DVAVEVFRQDHARVRALGGDQGDLRGSPVLLADRPDAVQPRRAGADDEVSGGHHRPPIASTRALRSTAKSASQSAVSASAYTMAAVGHASAQGGAPPARV